MAPGGPGPPASRSRAVAMGRRFAICAPRTCLRGCAATSRRATRGGQACREHAPSSDRGSRLRTCSAHSGRARTAGSPMQWTFRRTARTPHRRGAALRLAPARRAAPRASTRPRWDRRRVGVDVVVALSRLARGCRDVPGSQSALDIVQASGGGPHLGQCSVCDARGQRWRRRRQNGGRGVGREQHCPFHAFLLLFPWRRHFALAPEVVWFGNKQSLFAFRLAQCRRM